ncbi:MAG: zf-TFIIB domain-containing protein [Candidatus Omnitrophica bacterium]|nr:zf-TFIIB domain-containing protein [Candidatus Omnitrophota bacterium]
MIVLELDEVEIDHCISCGGIWLDGGELELLLETSTEKDKLLTSFQIDKDTKEKARDCPICLKRMDKVLGGIPDCRSSAGRDNKVLMDKCRQNDGIWFDLGELEQIIKMGSFDKGNKVLNLLKDMFKSRIKN